MPESQTGCYNISKRDENYKVPQNTLLAVVDVRDGKLFDWRIDPGDGEVLCGKQPGNFWRALGALSRGFETWLVLPDALPSLEALGAAEHLDTPPAFYLAQNGKFIMRFGRKGFPGLTVLDIRNWMPVQRGWTMTGLYQAWQKVKALGEPLSYTLAATSFAQWRAHFMPSGSVFVGDSQGSKQFQRKALYGGRAQVFHEGEYIGGCYAVDFASMYADVMTGLYYPAIPLEVYSKPGNCGLGHLETRLAAGAGAVAEVELAVDPVEFGGFCPFPRRTEDGIEYPAGTFETILMGPELQLAFSKGAVKGLGRVQMYNGDSTLFDDYVRHWYARKEQEKIEEPDASFRLAKLMLVTLHGRFAMQHEVWEPCDLIDDHSRCDYYQGVRDIDIGTGEIQSVDYPPQRYVLGQCQRQAGTRFHRFAAPRIAAQVESYGRLKLLSAMQRAGRSEVLYCDTDGMILTERGYNNLRGDFDDERLGHLRTEAHAGRVVINGIKSYKMYVGDRVVKQNAAGIPKSKERFYGGA